MVAVIIPLYKEHPSRFDLISIKQCLSILFDYPIIVIKPKSLSLKQYPFVFTEVLSLDDDIFKDIASYNKLMMSVSFYELFLKYEYILIHQTDAFVFRDELNAWCEKKYDYIGAPWLYQGLYPDFIKKAKEELKGYLSRTLNEKQEGTDLPSLRQLEKRVGNGGLSLRKISKFFELCKENVKVINTYLGRSEHVFNEDVFWSIEINRRKTQLKIPSYRKAAYFSIESYPEAAMVLTKGQLPFGCHAWDKNIDFYRSIFATYGYSI